MNFQLIQNILPKISLIKKNKINQINIIYYIYKAEKLIDQKLIFLKIGNSQQTQDTYKNSYKGQKKKSLSYECQTKIKQQISIQRSNQCSHFHHQPMINGVQFLLIVLLIVRNLKPCYTLTSKVEIKVQYQTFDKSTPLCFLFYLFHFAMMTAKMQYNIAVDVCAATVEQTKYKPLGS
ncbi:unnamed protein product [Paramecium sonneborni]|uniref:Uncharacterized protein n=1 Tax=Paramecium sonneborni TaxID=65129 RepID=A0A8S1P5D2_9CILI|nr:unnamed protein product [Paramecium sonneborni]